MENSKVSVSDALGIIVSFIRVCIEQIWYQLEIYPKESFKSYSFYGYQVYSSRHPAVIEYLNSFIEEFEKQMRDGIILRLFIEVFNQGKQVYSVGFSFKDSLLFQQLNSNNKLAFDSPNEQFDSFVLVNELKSYLYSLTGELSKVDLLSNETVGDFRLLVSTTDDFHLSTEKNWVFERQNNQNSNTHQTFKDVEIYPTKDVNLGYLQLKGYVAVHNPLN